MFEKSKARFKRFFRRVASFGIWKSLNGQARKEELSEIEDCRKYTTWTDAEGVHHEIHTMTDEHLLNAIKFLEKRKGWRRQYYPNMVLEAKKRNLLPFNYPDVLRCE